MNYNHYPLVMEDNTTGPFLNFVLSKTRKISMSFTSRVKPKTSKKLYFTLNDNQLK